LRHARMKKLQTVRGEIEMHQVALDSYRKYCEEVKGKGTDSDATRAAGDLHDRAVELGQFDVEKHVVDSLQSVQVTFSPSTILPDDETNVVGRVELKEVPRGKLCSSSKVCLHVSGEM